jgi:hypothetical protein
MRIISALKSISEAHPQNLWVGNEEEYSGNEIIMVTKRGRDEAVGLRV